MLYFVSIAEYFLLDNCEFLLLRIFQMEEILMRGLNLGQRICMTLESFVILLTRKL